MSESDAIALLGPPPVEHKVANEAPNTDGTNSVVRILEYGSLEYQSHQMRIVLPYRLYVTDGTVFTKQDPYSGRISPGAIEYPPVLISPPNGAIFAHYSSYVDLRWTPVSGTGRIRYDIEVQYPSGPGMPMYITAYAAESPQLTLLVPRLRDIQWRVRATNDSGAGPWSEYAVIHGRE